MRIGGVFSVKMKKGARKGAPVRYIVKTQDRYTHRPSGHRRSRRHKTSRA